MLPFHITEKGGFTQVRDSIPNEVRVSGRHAVGIVVDANNSPASRWQAVRGQLLAADVRAPIQPNPEGTVMDGLPRVGVWLMPDNMAEGELEDFVAQMIPSDDRVWPLSQGYVDGIPGEHRKFATGKTSRAKVHSWLAVREDPRLMGAAIRTHDLAIDGDLCRRFVAWLERLFGPPGE